MSGQRPSPPRRRLCQCCGLREGMRVRNEKTGEVLYACGPCVKVAVESTKRR